MKVGDLVYIPFLDTKGILTREVKHKDGRPLWEVFLIELNRTNLIYESDLIKVEVTKFEIGDIITGVPKSSEKYSITNEFSTLEVVNVSRYCIEVCLKYHPHFKEEIGERFFVDPSLFKKKETRFTNFRR